MYQIYLVRAIRSICPLHKQRCKYRKLFHLQGKRTYFFCGLLFLHLNSIALHPVVHTCIDTAIAACRPTVGMHFQATFRTIKNVRSAYLADFVPRMIGFCALPGIRPRLVFACRFCQGMAIAAIKIIQFWLRIVILCWSRLRCLWRFGNFRLCIGIFDPPAITCVIRRQQRLIMPAQFEETRRLINRQQAFFCYLLVQSHDGRSIVIPSRRFDLLHQIINVHSWLLWFFHQFGSFILLCIFLYGLRRISA